MVFNNCSTALIITGMHRSGTSLVASILQAGGLHIGDSLLAPDQLNPRGFFEDVEFYQFHQRALYRCGEITPYVEPGFTYAPTAAETEEARRLLEKRTEQTLWGWKDPRTSLFLNFWHQLMPDARYLFLYRHPFEVLLSFIRRGEVHTTGLLEALDSWHDYNTRLETFYRQHRAQCLMSHTYTLLHQPAEWRALLVNKLGLEIDLSPEMVAAFYRPDELHRTSLPIEGEAILSRVHPQAAGLYQHLNQLADLAEENDPPPPPSDEILTGFWELVDSLPDPLSPSQGRGVLFMLTELIQPGLLDEYFKAHNQQIIEFFKNVGHLQGQLGQQQEWATKQKVHIQEMSEYIEEQAKVYRHQKQWIETLETELAVVYNSKLWRAGRRLADSPLGGLIRKFSNSQNQ